MRGLLLVFFVYVLAVLPGCVLFERGQPDPTPEYFAVSHAAEPLWQGRGEDSMAHLRLRRWVREAPTGGPLWNTYNPHAKIVGSETILLHRDKGEVEAFVFKDARNVTPAGLNHYCIVYGELQDHSVLWSDADGFEPVVLPRTRIPNWFSGGAGGGIAVVPGQAIVVRSDAGLCAMNWAGERLIGFERLEGAEIGSVFPVLDDSAILIAHGVGPMVTEGASLWRPGEGLHQVVQFKEGSVQGPANAYYGFDADRDRIYLLSWPKGGRAKASRVLNVRGWSRTASSMSPDGRFIVSGNFGFKVIRNDPRIDEVHESGRTTKRRVAELGAYQSLDPVWLHPDFGAPQSVNIVPRPR